MRRTRATGVFLATSLLALGVGCASRPVVYSDARSSPASDAQVQADIDQCMTLARAHAREGQSVAREATRNTATSAAVGAATGAVGGAIWGNAGRGAATGAAVGGTAGLMRTVLRSRTNDDPVTRRYVERCLRERGHDVLGWR